jgi:hypothetical protein
MTTYLVKYKTHIKPEQSALARPRQEMTETNEQKRQKLEVFRPLAIYIQDYMRNEIIKHVRNLTMRV